MITGRMVQTLVLTALLVTGVTPTATLAASQGEITTRQDGERTVREYRLDGRLYAIEIIDNGQRQVLLDSDGNGNFRRQSEDTDIAPPAWAREPH